MIEVFKECWKLRQVLRHFTRSHEGQSALFAKGNVKGSPLSVSRIYSLGINFGLFVFFSLRYFSLDSAISKTWQKLSSNPTVSFKSHYNSMKEVMCMTLSITTVHVWAKSLVKEQSDLTKWGMAQWRPRLKPNGTILFASLGTANASQQLIEWDRSQSVIGVTLPFPEGLTWNHSLLISRSGQGCHCESSFYWPYRHSVQWVASGEALTLQVWRWFVFCILFSKYTLMFCRCHENAAR